MTLDPEMPQALKQVREAIQSARRPVLVNYGDPLFYGVARYLGDRLTKDQYEVIPHVSSMQLAFARVKETWEDALLTNLAGRPLETVVDRIRTADKAGLFTSDEHTPARVARALLEQGIDYFRAFVCEHLGQPDERVTQAELADLAEMEFDPLNVLILIRKAGRPDRVGKGDRRRLFGNPDDAFVQSQPKRGLITQAEVRSIALAQLDVRPTSVVWDIGAGSGSVAIEAAQLAHQGTVYAIEPEQSDLALIQANAESFGVPNVRPIAGRAPEALTSLPEPDAVFVGGTGRQVGPVLSSRGRLRPPRPRRSPRRQRRHHRRPRRRPPGLRSPSPARSPSGTSTSPARGIEQNGPRPLPGGQPDLPPGGGQGWSRGGGLRVEQHVAAAGSSLRRDGDSP